MRVFVRGAAAKGLGFGPRTGTSAVSLSSPPRRTTSDAGSSPMCSASALVQPQHWFSANKEDSRFETGSQCRSGVIMQVQSASKLSDRSLSDQGQPSFKTAALETDWSRRQSVV